MQILDLVWHLLRISGLLLKWWVRPANYNFIDMQSMSRSSVMSASSNKILEQVTAKSQSRIFSLEGIFNQEEIRVVWNAFGLYLSKNMRMGRGVTVPKFGIFTFTPPEIRLKGVTNPEDRDLRPRNPIFVISKDFVRGKELKPGVFYHQEFGAGIRPYTVYGSNGEVPVTKINLTEVSSYANMSKDSTELALNRIIKHLSEKTLHVGSCSIDIPSIGTFFVRNGMVAVKFNEFIQRDTRNVLSQSLEQRKQKGEMQLTSDNLKKFAILAETSSRLAQKPLDFLKIDEGTKDFIKKDFGLHFDQSNNMRRTVTNFDRTVATKEFNNKAQVLRDSHISRFRETKMSRMGYASPGDNNIKYQYNMALRLIKEWIYSNSYNSESSFIQFVNYAKGKKDLKAMLNESDVWQACKSISTDITEQQAYELFRILDVNKNGVVSLEEWNQVIKFDSNALLAKIIGHIQSQRLNVAAVINRMGITGQNSLDVYKLQTSLKQLCPTLNDQQASNLSRYLTKGEKSISVEDLKHRLELADELASYIKIDDNWKQKFLERIKRTLLQRNIYEEQLENKFGFYDSKHTGFINQAQFKDVLNSLGIILTLPELIKAMRCLSINNKTQIKYSDVVEKLRTIEISDLDRPEISFDTFFRTIEESFLRKKPYPFKLPLNITVLASQLQSRYFPDYSEHIIRKHLQQLDVDNNGQISSQDIETYLRRLDNQSLQSSLSEIPRESLDKLIQQIKEQTYKKRMSFHNLFKMLDANQDGFISPDEWHNIDKIIHLTPSVKQALFRHMDRANLSMIDYKVFLELLQGGTESQIKDEKFDWVKICTQSIRQWFARSNLLPADAFRVVDRDFDGYVSDKDITGFLCDTLKYQLKELTHSRIQKLLKVMDTFKRGKVDLVDFTKLLKGLETEDWIANAKQQIGLTLSRKFTSMNQAFNTVSRDEKNLVFNNFQKWMNDNKVLTGFMLNESMLKELFAELDPHKKGYLSESDFTTAFGKFDWKSAMVIEFVDTLQAKFGSEKEAFQHLCSYNKSSQILNYNQFSKSVKEIFGNRFLEDDIKEIWSQIAGREDSLNAQSFAVLINNKGSKMGRAIDKHYPRDDWAYQDFDIIKGTVSRSMQHAYEDKDNIEHQCRKIVETVKDILRTSPKTLQEAFKEADKGQKGLVTNLEFRHAFRILNIALTSKEIDLLLNFCEFGADKLINWKEFVKRFNHAGDKKKIFDRVQTKMQRFSDLLHYYMIAPKDAYRKYNNPSTGYMSFEQFYNMVKDLYKSANEALPEYAIIKELFQFIDVRKDGRLDYQQWVQTFRNHNPPSQIQGTRQPTTDKQPKQDTNKAPVRLQPLPSFQQSNSFEEFTRFIGRHRKYLLEQIQKLHHKSPLVEYSAVEKILKEVASQHDMKYSNEVYRNFMAFAMTGEKVDYRLLLNAFKQRSETIQEFPKQKVF